MSKVTDLAAWRSEGQAVAGEIPAAEISAGEWNFTVGRGADLFEKLRRMPVKLGEVADIFEGLQTSADKIYCFEQMEREDDRVKVIQRIKIRNIGS